MMKHYSRNILFVLFSGLFLFNASFFAQQKESKIKKEMIPNAEKIIGLEFTDAERDSMLDALNDQLNNYENIRKVHLDNSIPPAILFNPIPVAFKFDRKQKPLKFSDYSYVKMPKNIEDITFYSIGELAQLIKTKKITSTQLTKFQFKEAHLYYERFS